MLRTQFENASLAPSNRRRFLIGAAVAAGGLAVGFRIYPVFAQVAPAPVGAQPFGVYIEIGADNVVTVVSAHMDMGQGIYSGLATLVAGGLNDIGHKCAPAEAPAIRRPMAT